ncbi:MAG: Uma2 family endonuclease [Gemmataceae bacterium]|nr:Uma2 family endonuclease [Gemmataceae bacterium]
MNGLPSPAPSPGPTAVSTEVVYPDWDPDAMPELPPHLTAMLMLIILLRCHYRDSPDVYITGDVFWYYEEDNPQARKAPDVMVIKGVDPLTQRRSFKSWEHNTFPCFILEVISERTAAEDTVEKVRLYERLGVREYFLFDPEGAYQARPLVGYRLIGGKYEQLQPGAKGQLPSAELGLILYPDGDEVALVSMRTGERVPNPPEMRRQLGEVRDELLETRQRAEEEHQRAEEEHRRAEQERQRAEQAEQRAIQAQATAEAEKRQREQESQRAEQAEQRAAQAAQLAEQERHQKEQERQRAEQERRRAEELAAEVARLRAQFQPPQPPDEGTTPSP